MNIVVCIKQVPENPGVGLDRDTHTVRRSESKGVVSLADRYALELGLQLKAAFAGTLTAVSMGPAGADQALRQALAMGCDEAVLVTDASLAGSDTGATTAVLAAAIGQLDGVGLVLTGAASSDGATAQLAPRLAEALGFPLATQAVSAALEGDQLVVERNGEGRRETLALPLPAVVSVSLDAPKPRIPNAMGVMKAAKKPLATKDLASLGLSAEQVGAAGSCTWVTRSFKPEKREKGEVLTGSPSELASALVARLARKNLIEV